MTTLPPTRIGADVGGTFTDIVLQDSAGGTIIRKVPSTPPHYDKAVVEAIGALFRSDSGSVRADRVDELVHGTTIATNAVLEHRGGRTALVTTAGFRDVLELRRVRMPHLFEPMWTKPKSLVPRALRFEVHERILADGTVLQTLDPEEVEQLAERLKEAEVESVAICLLHSHRHPKHEELLGSMLRSLLPGVGMTVSSELLREQNEYERTATAVINAYVHPTVRHYLGNLVDGVGALGMDGPIFVMQSSGGLMTAADAVERPVYALESGPAAGVVAAQGLAKQLNLENVISFDMGGTTAKASLIENGQVLLTREYEVGAELSEGSRLLRGSGELISVPTVDVVEVGAGGGSVAWVDEAGGFNVGPRSAGAVPGPACYSKGGVEPTVTDANVVLGYLRSGRLAGGDITLSPTEAEDAVKRIATELGSSTLEAARSIHNVANARMMRALRAVSSQRGRDPRDFPLVAFGGAGPTHAARLAEDLGGRDVIIPPHAGVFSAAGLLYARPQFHDVRLCEVDARSPNDTTVLTVARLFDEMKESLADKAESLTNPSWTRSADMRYQGQNWNIEVEFPAGLVEAAALDALVGAFEETHHRTYGVRYRSNSPVEIRALRLRLIGETGTFSELSSRAQTRRSSNDTRLADFGAGYEPCDVFRTRADLGTDPVDGPLLIDEYDTTVVVPPGWSVRLHASGALIMHAANAADHSAGIADAASQEIFANALSSAADEMATTLFRTAHSTVVRDVMDFSAALVGPTGETVAQAVTIPFHLGSIPAAMETLFDRYGDQYKPGDIYILNDPFDGGMHLPDIFIVKPAFSGSDLVGFTVTTAHHGDVGGRVMGSAASDNTEIYQEGIRIPWTKIYDGGEPVAEIFRLIEANVRVPDTTLGDLNAQIAACRTGEKALMELATLHGAERLNDLMGALIDHSETLMRREIASWPDGEASFTDYLDSDGITMRDVPIEVSVVIEGDEITADLTRCSPMVRGALNSTRSFSVATVYHSIMSAAEARIPATAGAFRPIHVITKPGTIVHVVHPAASSMRGIVGFRLFDALNGALAHLIPSRIRSAGEGGNTLAIFGGISPGGAQFVYFELVVGTWGATAIADGNDGLSNPSATAANIPVEVAESMFPIIIERYGLVQDSGGAGQHRGGLAVERAWRTLVDTSLVVRSDRLIHAPYGLSAGSVGGRASNTVIQKGSSGPQIMPAMFHMDLPAQGLFHHIMAGGGGWGDPLMRKPESVLADILDEKVSVEVGREAYGVVLRDSVSVDTEATTRLRVQMRSAAHSQDLP